MRIFLSYNRRDIADVERLAGALAERGITPFKDDWYLSPGDHWPSSLDRHLGYAGSYDAVRRYARAWRREHGAAMAEAHVPLSFALGEAYQFDWSHEIIVLNGVTVKVAHVRLCHSRMLFVRAVPPLVGALHATRGSRPVRYLESTLRSLQRGSFLHADPGSRFHAD